MHASLHDPLKGLLQSKRRLRASPPIEQILEDARPKHPTIDQQLPFPTEDYDDHRIRARLSHNARILRTSLLVMFRIAEVLERDFMLCVRVRSPY